MLGSEPSVFWKVLNESIFISLESILSCRYHVGDLGAYLARVPTRHLPCRRDYLGGTHVLRRRALPRVGHLDRMGVGRHLGGSDPSMGRPYDTLLPYQGSAEPGSLIYEYSISPILL